MLPDFLCVAADHDRLRRGFGCFRCGCFSRRHGFGLFWDFSAFRPHSQLSAGNIALNGAEFGLQLADAFYQRGHVFPAFRFAGMKGRAFQPDSGRRGKAQLAFRVQKAVQHPQKPAERKPFRLLPKTLLVLSGHVQQGGGVFLHRLHGHQHPAMAAQVLQKHLRLPTGAHQFVHLAQNARCVPVGDAVHKGKQELPVGGPQRVPHLRGSDLSVFRTGHAHIQNAERITHGAFGGPRHQLQRFRFGSHVKLVQCFLHAADHQLRRNTPEIIPLHPGQDGGGQLLGFGSRQNKDHMGRRFLQRFQKRVEGGGGQHVNFVDDVDLVFSHLGGIAHLFQQFADVIHAVVGGCVQLQHVHGAFGLNGAADLALAAGIAVIGIQAVDGPAHQLGHGGFARSAAAAEQIGMGDLPRFDLMPQGFDRCGLPYHAFEGLRPPAAV